MSECSYTILGSSAGVPQVNRGSSGYVMRTGESLALIDCGGSVCQNFLRAGFDPTKIDRIFITHTHPDHVVELPLLLQMLYLGPRKNPVDLYLPEEFVDSFERMLEAMYIFRSRFKFELRIVGYDDQFSFEGVFSLKAIANSHLRKYAPFVSQAGSPSRLQCFSYDLVLGGKTIFHSGDVGGFEDVEPYLQGHDYVVLEAAHLDVDRLLKFAQASRVGQYVITHLQSDEQGLEIARRARVADVTNLVVAQDGWTVEL